MATDKDVNSLKNILLGKTESNPRHFPHSKTFSEKVGGTLIVGAVIVAAVGIFYKNFVDFIISPVERIQRKPMNNNRKRY